MGLCETSALTLMRNVSLSQELNPKEFVKLISDDKKCTKIISLNCAPQRQTKAAQCSYRTMMKVLILVRYVLTDTPEN